ncbi:MAG: hypothetical protein Q4C08_02870, partial [Pseudomonadota bacterium]|nr:hypothetical protein [Pseudomonadota bacterium]
QFRITTKIEMKKGEIRMPYDVKRFIFSVSLCAMLVVTPALATAPGENESVGTAHDVYVESELDQATNGIAGVSYVNRMVNAAGNAADKAEAHAAAAGAHALSAAKSAKDAHTVLADKVNIDQGTDNINKVMVTNDEGMVSPGYIKPDMIKAPEGLYMEDAPVLGMVSWTPDGRTEWQTIIGPEHEFDVLTTSSGVYSFDRIGPESTYDIVGSIPVGSADSTTYGQLWIE